LNTFPCPSWEHFIKLARNDEAGRVAGSGIYRGHANPNWKLASKFERWLEQQRGHNSTRSVADLFGPHGPEAFENGYLKTFKAYAIGLPGLSTNDLSEDDWWALGRHHGLITRLLDWTSRPYTAAFFAFADFAARWVPGFAEHVTKGDKPAEVVIWRLAPYRDIQLKGEFDVLEPKRDQFHRQRAQAGLYTRLRHDLQLDLASYLEAKGTWSLPRSHSHPFRRIRQDPERSQAYEHHVFVRVASSLTSRLEFIPATVLFKPEGLRVGPGRNRAKWKSGQYVASDRRSSWVKIKNRNYSQLEGREELIERR
jgi:FRG domain